MNIDTLINTRYSTRDFRNYIIEQEEKQKIIDNFREIRSLFEKTFDWEISDSEIASNKIKADIDFEIDNLIDYGFQGEQILLQLLKFNYDTCWVGIKNEKYPAKIIFGKSNTTEVPTRRRKDLDKFILNEEDISHTFKEIIKFTILAPSSLNSQPWKFKVIDYNSIEVTLVKTRIKDINYIDFGICLAHMYLKGMEYYKDITFNKIDNQRFIVNFK